MRYAAILDRLNALGAAKWDIYYRAQALEAAGHDIIDLTIGNPDVPAPEPLIEAAVTALRAGRTEYSDGRGEPALRAALARRYSDSTGREITPAQILCFPGTQTALYAVMTGLAEPGTEVLVGDPMYATYEGVIRASGAEPVPVPLRPERGFRLSAEDLAARVTPRTRALLLNSPQNPTGAVLRAEDIAAIGEIARAHDLWIVADEVYDELIFSGAPFASPLADPALAERTVVVSSISKSHAAPGFRSGWAVLPEEAAARLAPLSDTMLFGNQPFIADATALAVSAPSATARGMAARLSARAQRLAERLEAGPLKVNRPEAGMFALIDIRATGMSDAAYAADLLEKTGVALMPGSVFGPSIAGWVRLALTVPDAKLDEAITRILTHAERHMRAPSRAEA
ncbi:pyridoxal phosphate-dependent aminotransferase [Pseudoroseicyclus sp. CXY001]|uniref:pyridoxal phosphate-dependent aminotransferase n=1 Tax=Pseudoroseicyclus sp. CXY001 TaxID=3242492 RepID=UPI00358DD0F2